MRKIFTVKGLSHQIRLAWIWTDRSNWGHRMLDFHILKKIILAFFMAPWSFQETRNKFLHIHIFTGQWLVLTLHTIDNFQLRLLIAPPSICRSPPSSSRRSISRYKYILTWRREQLFYHIDTGGFLHLPLEYQKSKASHYKKTRIPLTSIGNQTYQQIHLRQLGTRILIGNSAE